MMLKHSKTKIKQTNRNERRVRQQLSTNLLMGASKKGTSHCQSSDEHTKFEIFCIYVLFSTFRNQPHQLGSDERSNVPSMGFLFLKNVPSIMYWNWTTKMHKNNSEIKPHKMDFWKLVFSIETHSISLFVYKIKLGHRADALQTPHQDLRKITVNLCRNVKCSVGTCEDTRKCLRDGCRGKTGRKVVALIRYIFTRTGARRRCHWAFCEDDLRKSGALWLFFVYEVQFYGSLKIRSLFWSLLCARCSRIAFVEFLYSFKLQFFLLWRCTSRWLRFLSLFFIVTMYFQVIKVSVSICRCFQKIPK